MLSTGELKWATPKKRKIEVGMVPFKKEYDWWM